MCHQQYFIKTPEEKQEEWEGNNAVHKFPQRVDEIQWNKCKNCLNLQAKYSIDVTLFFF